MLCNGNGGTCNTNVEATQLADRDHYKCVDCGESWDTTRAFIMDSSGKLVDRVIRRPCSCQK